MNDLLNRLQPLCYAAIIIVIIISFIKSIFKGDFKGLFGQILICAVIAYMVNDPTSILKLGKFLVENVMSFGGGIIDSSTQ
ncbi:MAG: TcpD family membrane protein [Clostridiales bacterium]